MTASTNASTTCSGRSLVLQVSKDGEQSVCRAKATSATVARAATARQIASARLSAARPATHPTASAVLTVSVAQTVVARRAPPAAAASECCLLAAATRMRAPGGVWHQAGTRMRHARVPEWL